MGKALTSKALGISCKADSLRNGSLSTGSKHGEHKGYGPTSLKIALRTMASGKIARIKSAPGKSARGRRVSRWAAVLLAVLPVVPAYAHAHHSEAWARDRFASAERMREALNGRPTDDRSRHDYQKVLDAYRSVYFGAPTSAKADPSVVAVAEILVEMGRRFEDNKILKEAISQYRFLRREYPGSKYRFDALFTIGEIYKDDLGNAQQARVTFEEFLRRYPHHRLAADAQQAIADLKHPESEDRSAGAKLEKNNHKANAPKDENQNDEEQVAAASGGPTSCFREGFKRSRPESGQAVIRGGRRCARGSLAGGCR
jgi:tetratricopeptide (TPR) repeat protein